MSSSDSENERKREIERRDKIFTADGLPEIDDSVFLRLGLTQEDLDDPSKRSLAYQLLSQYFSAIKEGHLALLAKSKADIAPMMQGLEKDLKLKKLDIMKIDEMRKKEDLEWTRGWRKKGHRNEKEALQDESI